jgi:uncharacterized membrane protein YvlD (DUF360 family)
MNTIVPLLIATALIGVVSGIAIWTVNKLGLGLEVDNFGAAFIAGIIIAFIVGIISWLLGLVGIMDGGGFIGGIVHLIVAAVALMIGGRLLPKLRVAGLAGAFLAAAVIGVLYWLGGLLLGAVI